VGPGSERRKDAVREEREAHHAFTNWYGGCRCAGAGSGLWGGRWTGKPGGDTRLDINDVYAFQSPSDSEHAVLIMTVSPLAGVVGATTFHPDAIYQLLADTNGDGKADETAKFTFGPPNASGVQKWRVKGTGKNAQLKATGTTGVVTDLGVLKITAGKFDDPFFFDLVNFLAIDFDCSAGDVSNFFLGANTLAIVMEFPRSALPGTVGMWARTLLEDEGGVDGNDNVQVDRMGRPAINTVFIPNNIFEPVGSEPSQRNAFNAGKPQHDQRDFRGEVVDTLDIFHTTATANTLADILLPDTLTVDFSSTAGFLNGRQLANDVIDAELGIVTNGAVTSDCVASDSAFTTTFPYLAPAN
jgi:hypothetical protein